MLSLGQLKARASGLGGTDVVAICGESNYRGPIDVYLEKRHGLGLPIDMAPPKPFEGNERTEWGHILEPVLAARYADDTGLHLVEPQITYRSTDHEWMLGTPDRLCYDIAEDANLEKGGLWVLDSETGSRVSLGRPRRIWEAKSHGMMAAKGKYDLAAMTVPDDKKLQVAWYRALTGCKESELSALIDTHLYRVFHVPHDQAVEDYLLEEAEAFWGNVLNGIEPSPDGTEMFSRYLKGRFQTHVEDMIEVEAETLSEIVSYKAARDDRKVADGKMKLAQQKIQLAIGAHQGLIGPDGKPVATWKRRSVGVCSHSKVVERLRDELEISDRRLSEIKEEFTGEPPRTFLVK